MYNINEPHLNTTLSRPYCIGWYQKKRTHAMMASLSPICGTKTKKPERIENQLTAKQAFMKLKSSYGCAHCMKKLNRTGVCHANP